MEELDDLDAYNGSLEHDSWVDFDYNENTGELSDLFDDEAVDEYITLTTGISFPYAISSYILEYYHDSCCLGRNIGCYQYLHPN